MPRPCTPAPTQHWLEFKRKVATPLCAALWPETHRDHPERVQYVFDSLLAVRIADRLIRLTLPPEIPQALLPRRDPLDPDVDRLSLAHSILLQLHRRLYRRLLPWLLKRARWGCASYWTAFWQRKKRTYRSRDAAVAVAREIRYLASMYLDILRLRRAHLRELRCRREADPAAVALYEERCKVWARGDEARQRFWARRYSGLVAKEELAREGAKAVRLGRRERVKLGFKIGVAVCREGAEALCAKWIRLRSGRRRPEDEEAGSLVA